MVGRLSRDVFVTNERGYNIYIFRDMLVTYKIVYKVYGMEYLQTYLSKKKGEYYIGL